MALHTSSDQQTGTVIGAIIGFIKGMIAVIAALNFMGILETAVYAAVGATVGFLVTSFWQRLKKKYVDKDKEGTEREAD